MASSNSNRLLIIGAGVFVVGVILVLVIVYGLGGRDEGTTVVQPTDQPTTPQQPAVPAGPIVRIPQPVDVPEGHEAVAVAMSFTRGLAAVPLPGDLVNVYVLPQVGVHLLSDPNNPTSAPVLPPTAQLAFREVEVLAITGPDATAGTGEPVLVVAVAEADAARFLPLSEARQLWFTLLPQPEETGTESV